MGRSYGRLVYTRRIQGSHSPMVESAAQHHLPAEWVIFPVPFPGHEGGQHSDNQESLFFLILFLLQSDLYHTPRTRLA